MFLSRYRVSVGGASSEILSAVGRACWNLSATQKNRAFATERASRTASSSADAQCIPFWQHPAIDAIPQIEGYTSQKGMERDVRRRESLAIACFLGFVTGVLMSRSATEQVPAAARHPSIFIPPPPLMPPPPWWWDDLPSPTASFDAHGLEIYNQVCAICHRRPSNSSCV